MFNELWKKIKKAFEDRITSTVALIIGTFIGSIITFLGSSVVFTFTASTRLDSVEAAVKVVPQLQSDNKQSLNDISEIKGDVKDLKLEFENYLISKSK